jgi:multiple sugar transport system permease protein
MLKPTRSVILIFLGPAVLFYLIIFLYPTVRTIFMTFFAVEGVSDPIARWTFNGIANYIKAFSDMPLFIQSLRNILRIWFFGGLGVMFLAMLFALILTMDNFKGMKFFRAVIYLPNLVSAVAMAGMWLTYVYHAEFGFLTGIFKFLQGNPELSIQWTGPGTRFWALLVAYSFGMVGYHMLIFISGIDQIPRDYHDAATIDGAGVLQRFVYVTLPFIRGVTRTNIVMWTVFIVGFFVWGHLFSPISPSNDTAGPLNVLYHTVFGTTAGANIVRDSGTGAVMGVSMMVMVIVVFFATSFIVKNDDVEV